MTVPSADVTEPRVSVGNVFTRAKTPYSTALLLALGAFASTRPRRICGTQAGSGTTGAQPVPTKRRDPGKTAVPWWRRRESNRLVRTCRSSSNVAKKTRISRRKATQGDAKFRLRRRGRAGPSAWLRSTRTRPSGWPSSRPCTLQIRGGRGRCSTTRCEAHDSCARPSADDAGHSRGAHRALPLITSISRASTSMS